MHKKSALRKDRWRFWLLFVAPYLLLSQIPAMARPSPQNPSTGKRVRPIGVVTEIQPGRLTLHTDAGQYLTVSLPDGVSVLRVPPGAKSLKEAAKIDVSEISMGDRVLIIGPVSADQKSITAKSVIVMSKTALAKAREAEQLEWEEHGVAGIVKIINPATKEITLAVPNPHPTPGNLTRPLIVTLAPNASLLRYAPDSVKFSDAKPGTFGQIEAGDQVRALGMKSADGTHFTAEKLVSGTFRNIGATVISVDASQGTLTVKDLATGKPVLVSTNTDSQLHQLTAAVANEIAMFNAGAPQKGAPGQLEPRQAATPTRPAGYQGRGRLGNTPMSGSAAGGPPRDFEQMLRHMPSLSLSELKAGEPLIIVSTEGAQPSQVTAIAVLSGVEPILRARPKGSTEVGLGPWNMSMGGGGGGQGDESGGQSGGGGGQGGEANPGP
jgi:hypothetical protein